MQNNSNKLHFYILNYRFFFRAALERFVDCSHDSGKLAARTTRWHSRFEYFIFFSFFEGCMHVQRANGQLTNECIVCINFVRRCFQGMAAFDHCWPLVIPFYSCGLRSGLGSSCKHRMDCNVKHTSLSLLSWLHPSWVERVRRFTRDELIPYKWPNPNKRNDQEWPTKLHADCRRTKTKRKKSNKILSCDIRYICKFYIFAAPWDRESAFRKRTERLHTHAYGIPLTCESRGRFNTPLPAISNRKYVI